MKLIDLLVQELPKLGGWPIGVKSINQAHDGQLEDYSSYCGSYSLYRGISFPLSDNYRLEANCVSECSADFVTREQYEAALAASKQIEWNGDGLPPVGCDVEFNLDTYKYSAHGIIPENGRLVNVVAHKVTTDENPVAVVYWDDKGAGRAAAFIKEAFRPMRSETERKREDTKNAIAELCRSSASNGHSADLIYDAIAAGKITGLKLDLS